MKILYKHILLINSIGIDRVLWINKISQNCTGFLILIFILEFEKQKIETKDFFRSLKITVILL